MGFEHDLSRTPAKDRLIKEGEIVKGRFAFLWPVPLAGVQWRADFFPVQPGRRRDDDRGPGQWLVAAATAPSPPRGEPGRKRYAPLSHGRLHVRFAKLKTDDDIERFASRYGLLGHAEHGVVGGRAGPIRFAESHGRWTREIEAMRAVLEQWEVVRSREPARGAVDPDRLRVYKTVNDKLEGHISSVAHPARGGEILHWPDCLLAALYLLLQLELAGRPARPSVYCEDCGRLIENPGNSRRQFCDATCGNHYRYRYNHPKD